ncbi:proline dehydrogenase family protein [Chryseobacterium binzhouense]|uniref:proline dehydrogenase family protein n=1 Tax=Chryseobacterium binzhouense TaxID=2593646 RepID=UPI0028A2CDF9|nr:proline dehydrogenase family protein [Chryseobacterium binzhouense]
MEQELLKIASEALKKAALNEEAKNFVLQNEKLFKTLKKAANRYIGGETIAETVSAIKELNENGFAVTTDFMGESIRNEKEANEAAQEFVNFARTVESENLNSSISLDLSHIGLLVSEDLTINNLKIICEEASKTNQEVIISMEGTDRTDMIINIYKEVLKTHSNLGITLQAYLYRTKSDFEDLIRLSGSIRMVKGAYDTPKGLSIPRGEELDKIYLNYAEQLLAKNHKCAIASHDSKIHHKVIELIDKYSPTNYVLERLLGICNEELHTFKNQGYQCRIYVVYGKEWYLYLCNRWAEYPLNLFRGLADIVE